MGTYHLDDIHFEGPNLDVPDPPADLPYDQFEDYRTREILARNGASTEEGILQVLQTRDGPLQAAAAHTAGSMGIQAAVPILEKLMSAPDDYVQVEAGYALVRLGVDRGLSSLVRALQGNAEVNLSPSLSAGYLAQLGDSQGFPTVSRALGSEFDPVRMTACKQLYFFMRFHGHGIDALELFRRALGDPSPNIQWQALVQLKMLAAPVSRELLEDYASQGTEDLREVARQILSSI